LPWLLGVANHVIADHRRAEQRRLKALQRLAAAAPQLIEHEDRALSAELVRELRRLSVEDRDALLLVVWGELSHEEAATALGVPIGTVNLGSLARDARSRPPSIHSSAVALANFAKPSFSMPERRTTMDLLYAMRDLGVVDLAADSTGEETARAALAKRSIGRPSPGGPAGRDGHGPGCWPARRRRWRRRRRRWRCC
jgi:hypothetical protein